MEIKKAIQRLAEIRNEVYAKICEVISVDKNNKTVDLRPIDGSSDILDVYLVVDDAKGCMYLEPEVGSLVCVVFITNEIAIMVNSSTLKQLQVKISGTEFQIDKDGFLLKKENETLKALMIDLVNTIMSMKFTTNTGSTIRLVNKPEFQKIKNRFETFLKDK